MNNEYPSGIDPGGFGSIIVLGIVMVCAMCMVAQCMSGVGGV